MTTPIETLEALSKHAKQVLKNITVEDLVEALRLANEKYRNDEETLITDALYDMALEHLEKIAPNHPFLSEIGASVKGEKVKIPYWMGSLDKIKDDAKTIEKWRKTYPGECVISDKLDGISALLVFLLLSFSEEFFCEDAIRSCIRSAPNHIPPSLTTSAI